MAYRPSSYALAWEALRLYREEMRAFVVDRLQETYGDLWMAQGVEKHFKLEEIDNLRRILGTRDKAGIVNAAAESMADMLDINHFRQIIEANWGPVFKSAIGDRTILDSWIAEVTSARNALAHWSGGEMPRKDALRVIDTCERVVRSISAARADELLSIWQTVDAMGSDETLDARRATIVFEDGAQPARATVLFDEQPAGVKPFSMAKAREKHPRAYEPWTKEEEARLVELYGSGYRPAAIGAILGRQASAVRSRLQRLGIDNPPGHDEE